MKKKRTIHRLNDVNDIMKVDVKDDVTLGGTGLIIMKYISSTDNPVTTVTSQYGPYYYQTASLYCLLFHKDRATAVGTNLW
jgi:hypothetical protein